ncbi:MAG: hypothetical protein A2428_14940 [Bdellovibrionales bacterium RIFOXYC1_FULL_54_43]|nr:MAG: hypothetical protein A2428_14940 [Bdellovibrionales bacterium RIFOXYC1_FULL_54_43]
MLKTTITEWPPGHVRRRSRAAVAGLTAKLICRIVLVMDIAPEQHRSTFGSNPGNPAELLRFFESANLAHFDGFLEVPQLQWNGRLRSCAGRFIPGSRKFLRAVPSIIEIASYLRNEPNADALILDTMAHEMIHYWLWVRRQPFGHTAAFMAKMREMGVSRYNPAPRPRPFRYLYCCAVCGKEFPARKKLGVLACAKCCKAHSNGRYDSRFRLLLYRRLSVDEGLELAHKPR